MIPTSGSQAAEPWTHILRHERGQSGTMRDGKVQFNQKISWPVSPFIGTLAVAPELGSDNQYLWAGSRGREYRLSGYQAWKYFLRE